MIRAAVAVLGVMALGLPLPVAAQAPPAAPPAIKATVPASSPPWSKGIQPLNRDSYYHAIECGKNGAAQPSCVFYDADLCKNDDYVLSFYSPYKQVAYEVWGAVSRKRPAPTTSYQAAQQTRESGRNAIWVASDLMRGSAASKDAGSPPAPGGEPA